MSTTRLVLRPASRQLPSHPQLRSFASKVAIPSTDPPSSASISKARQFCLDTLRKHDTPASLLLPYIPRPARDAYIALRAFNIDVARTADTTSTPTIAAMRLQFHRDAITKSLNGTPPAQPVALLLAKAAEDIFHNSSGKSSWSKSWFMRIIDTREKYLSNTPYTDMDALERYAENTYSTLLYLTLQALPMASVTADHVASHIGKAVGITAVLRGLPILAFPGPPNKHNNQGAQLGGDVGATRHGAVTLPLTVMGECGVREEDVLRNGSQAKGLKDAVFMVATKANDHLITARQMLGNVRAGEDAGHEFEHGDEQEHNHTLGKETPSQEVERAFGVFMPAIATQLWLNRLEKADFDIFDSKLRVTDWRLPFKAFWGYNRMKL